MVANGPGDGEDQAEVKVSGIPLGDGAVVVSWRSILPSWGAAVPVAAGDTLRIQLPQGPQIVDLCLLSSEDPTEHYSTGTQMALEGGRITRGTTIWGCPPRSRPLATCTADTVRHAIDGSSRWDHVAYGAHCNPHLWVGRAEHVPRTCYDNLVAALREVGLDQDAVCDNLNLFMNTELSTARGDMVVGRSVAERGDHVEFHAHVPLVAAMSLCPLGPGADVEQPHEFWDEHHGSSAVDPVEVVTYRAGPTSATVEVEGG